MSEWLYRFRDATNPRAEWHPFNKNDTVEVANSYGETRSGLAKDFYWGYEDDPEATITKARLVNGGTMRTDEEIIQRIEERRKEDFFGFEISDLIVCLPAEKAKPFLKEGADLTDWSPASRDREAILKQMADYMPFAWDKANNCRGISASRSMSHYTSWIWLIGDDLGNLDDYEFYGKDNLAKICKHYGWDHTQWDDGIRVNSESEIY
jgi:hypothetical protein